MAAAAPSASAPRAFVLASRGSALAQVQTNIVLSTLQSAFPTNSFSTSFIATGGDKNQSQALYLLGGKSLWTKELEVALLEGTVDMLVHSLKDVPTVLPDGCVLGAILDREDALDSFIAKKGLTVAGKPVKTLDDLPDGSVIGTSSVRRVAQLKRNYPKLAFKDVVRRLRYHTHRRRSRSDAGLAITARKPVRTAPRMTLTMRSAAIDSRLTPPQ